MPAIPFEHSFAQTLPATLFSAVPPEPAPQPHLLAYNAPLAALLGITGDGDVRELAEVFSGARLPDGAFPIAQLYAGHQFGHYTPQLGDGRALLLGETVGTDGVRRDIQLKGSGRTPYSRGGDGKAWLGPVLREYVVSEAMNALGIPTTRALAAVATGAPVYRERALPGAVLTRVARSHIRVGHFQVLAARGDVESLRALFEYTVARHYPGINNEPAALLEAVSAAQMRLVIAWMGVGFVHGVMNTDNTQIAGETIDYGPCAFLDAYKAMQVFSSIDHRGRYAYANQPSVLCWNMAQLATALVPLMPDQREAVEVFTGIINAMPGVLDLEWRHLFVRKIGLVPGEDDAGDFTLVTDLLTLMEAEGADFTNTFRWLGTPRAAELFPVWPERFAAWERRWRQRLGALPERELRQRLDGVNPWIIPRTHQLEAMIRAAVEEDDITPFTRLSDALATPFQHRDGFNDLTAPPTPEEIVPATFCGT